MRHTHTHTHTHTHAHAHTHARARWDKAVTPKSCLRIQKETLPPKHTSLTQENSVDPFLLNQQDPSCQPGSVKPSLFSCKPPAGAFTKMIAYVQNYLECLNKALWRKNPEQISKLWEPIHDVSSDPGRRPAVVALELRS